MDEITNMNSETQAKLLRVLQEGEVRPLGSNKTKKVYVRVIVAASENLEEQVSSGSIRSDLFYRLNVVSIHSPPLRERVEDIPTLAETFLQKFVEKHGKTVRIISSETMQSLEQYSWPGYIRELENAMERAVVLVNPEETNLLPEHLPQSVASVAAQEQSFELPLSGDLPALVADYERDIIQKVLLHHNWNQTAAAKALNISERVMRYKIERLGLCKPG